MCVAKNDHNSITFDIAAPPSTQESKILSFIWRAGDYQQISDFLTNVDWTHKFSGCADVNDYWSTFLTVLFDAFNRFVPKRRVTITASDHGSATSAKKCINRKLFAKRKCFWQCYKLSRSAIHLNTYKKCNCLFRKHLQ